MKTPVSRRNVLAKTAKLTAGGMLASGLGGIGGASASVLTHPRATSLKELDKNEYISNLSVHAKFHDQGLHSGKAQMLTIGERRFLFYRRSVVEVTNPLKPTVVKANAYLGGQEQLAYNAKARKWVLITNSSAPFTQRNDSNPLGKYGDPSWTAKVMGTAGLRGVRIYDCTDPFNVKLLSEWSSDQGDPKRPMQTGDGPHRFYYDGGKYAYLSAAPDNSFIRQESPDVVYSWAVQIIDVEDPSNPKFVANWWFPGQRLGEESAYKLWEESGDRLSFTGSHGPLYVPQRVEDGGKYCYIAYSSFGFVTLDVSNPKEPKLVGQWKPPYGPSNIPVHTIYPAWLDKGLMLVTAESFNADCYEPFIYNYMLDVKDLANPKELSSFGNWVPPPNAPYKDFCDARGRKGTHNPPHIKAPGKLHPSWCGFSAFNAGFQGMDFSDPSKPRSTGYFIPPNPGNIEEPRSYIRLGESVFVEWDRNLIWFGSLAGLYLLSDPALGKPIFDKMAVKEWTLPGLNAGAPS